MEPCVFVTVGTTRFDALVESASHATFLAAARRLGFASVVIQHGQGPAPRAPPLPLPASAPLAALSFYGLKPDIGADVRGAGVVVSHAGAGSVFEALRAGRRLLVACNPALAGNHQEELAGAMAQGGHCSVAASPLTPAALAAGLAEAASRSFLPLPAPSHPALLGALRRRSAQRSPSALACLFLLTAALLALYLLLLKPHRHAPA